MAANTAETTRTIEENRIPTLLIFVVFYSMYEHVEILARRMKKGVDGVDGVEATLYRVLETLSHKVVEQMKVPPKVVFVESVETCLVVGNDGAKLAADRLVMLAARLVGAVGMVDGEETNFGETKTTL